MNNPIPSNMKSEAKKAAKILREFTEISNRTGPDKLIPANILAKCQGLAIITVIKAGFMITARGGSGIVIARLADGRWSAPSAIGIAGLGGGFEIGVEVSDLVVILMQRRAVDSFSKGGNLTLGGNCTVAVGPMGRNVEADVALRSTAAVFTYCKSRGLFAGVSLEGSCLIERKDTNRKFYSQDIRASAILNGDVEPPPEADDLYCVLESYTDKYTTEWTAKHLAQKLDPWLGMLLGVYPARGDVYAVKPSLYPSVSAFKSGSTESYKRSPSSTRTVQSDYGGVGPWDAGPVVVTAVHPFTGQQPGDLSFNPGDRITVVTKTESQYDWWEGTLNGRTGIFPANFVSYP
ncbi:SH3 domain-containing YSC84-like protein 1 [Oncorhynchus masou masou]|uniref:SH3 domain-containing YSC84-like protein 1 n=1 Tax=Oncorhynchus masou masou TaxID=90313 RepID=UPI0031841CCF